jgi:hypothetical protein
MKKAMFAAAFLAVLVSVISSCKKKSTPPFTYSVTGLTNIAVTAGDSATIPVHVTTLTGNAEDVILTVTGLPANVNGTITPNSGKPNYSAQLKIVAGNDAVAGTSAITLNATSPSTGAKPYSANLTVNPKPDCSSDVEGIYTCTDVCTQGNDAYTMVVSATSIANKVMINNFYGEGFDVAVTLDCNAHTVTIPNQTINGVTFSGSGTFNGSTMTIAYTVVGQVASNSCTVTMSKQ